MTDDALIEKVAGAIMLADSRALLDGVTNPVTAARIKAKAAISAAKPAIREEAQAEVLEACVAILEQLREEACGLDMHRQPGPRDTLQIAMRELPKRIKQELGASSDG